MEATGYSVEGDVFISLTRSGRFYHRTSTKFGKQTQSKLQLNTPRSLAPRPSVAANLQ